jgi:hypothetical protein
MLRTAAVLTLFLTATLSAAAFGQASDVPHKHDATLHHSRPMVLKNPGASSNTSTMSGQGCIGPRANAAQTAINPINGQKQAAPIVAVPLTSGAGTVASATNRAQQNQACVHGH